MILLHNYNRRSFNNRKITKTRIRSYCWHDSFWGAWEMPACISSIEEGNCFIKRSKERSIWEIESEIEDILE